MEFHEKLQHLRRQHDLTQEQLAEKLFVSRTAVSKWESGRGYPNLDSLKSLSKLFEISLDDLLSGDELLAAAETENRANLRCVTGIVFGALDVLAVALLFLPLFGQQEGDYIRAVTLWQCTAISPILRKLFAAYLLFLAAFGVFQLVVQMVDHERWLLRCRIFSFAFHSAAVFLFAVSRHPYVTALLFLLLMVKVALLIQENRIRS